MRELSVDTAALRRYAVQQVSIAVAIGVTLGLLGPFGTYEQLGTSPRIVYWTALALSGLLFFPGVNWIARISLGRKGWPVWLWLPASTAVAAVPMTLLAVGLTHAMLGASVGPVTEFYPYVFTIGLAVSALKHMLWRASTGSANSTLAVEAGAAAAASGIAPAAEKSPAEEASAGSSAAGTAASFLSRLPPRLGHDILCLEMEDHYVRVHTRTGSDLLLMRMRDAVAELNGVDGLQVHRSWWVARSAVVAVRRQDKSATLVLANGIEAPVARDRMPILRAAGWLNAQHLSDTPSAA